MCKDKCTSWEALFPVFLGLPNQMPCGRNYNACWVSAMAFPYLAYQLAVIPSHPRRSPAHLAPIRPLLLVRQWKNAINVRVPNFETV